MPQTKSQLSRRAALAALGGSIILPAMVSGAVAADRPADAASLEKAAETLRVAMVAGDGKVLDALLHDRLTYSHSDGRVQAKWQVMNDLAGKKAFASVTLSDQTVDVVGTVGVVRHIFDSVNNKPDGTTSTAHIKALQVWVKAAKGWKLLARSATAIKA